MPFTDRWAPDRWMASNGVPEQEWADASLEEITKSGVSSRIVTGRFKESTEENAGDSGKENTEKRTEEKTLERFEKKRREGEA